MTADACRQPSSAGVSCTAIPSMNVATTRAWPMAPAPRSNRSRSRTARSAVLPDLDRAEDGLEVVDPGTARREGRQGVVELEPLIGQERGTAAVLVADPRDRHLHLTQRIGGRDGPVGAHRQPRPGREQGSEGVLPRGPLRSEEGDRELVHLRFVGAQ